MARTTLDIDGSVLRELRIRQRREGKTLGQLVSELLAAALSRSAEPSPPLDWQSAPLHAKIDLEDKEALYKALDEA